MVRTAKSIKSQLIISIVVTTIIFLGTMLFAGFNLMKNYSLTNAEELAVTVLNDTDNNINQFFSEIENLARSLAAYKVVYKIDENHLKDLFLANVMARKKYMRAIYLGTKEGRMFEYGYGEGFLDNTAVLPEDYDPRIRSWYQEAVAAGDYTIARPYIYASIKALGITGAMPVYHPDGEFVGILGIDILLDSLTNLIEQLKIQKQGKAILINEEGEIIVDQFAEVLKYSTELKQFTLKEPQELILAKEGSFIGEIAGEKMYFAYKRNNITGWILIIALPYNTIMAVANKTIGVIAAIDILLMIMVIVVIGMLSSRIIIKPLKDIMGVMQRLENGEQKARVAVKSRDEFAVLGRQFNRLVDIIEEYSKELQEKVIKRTKEVGLLQQENIRLRVIEEKERIYEDLHDSLGARLTNIFICNNVAKTVGRKSNYKLKDMLDRIGNNCQLAIKDLKEIIFGMQYSDRVIIDFSKFIVFNIKKRLSPKNIAFDYRITHAEELNSSDRDIRFEIEKLLQELVSNVLKHSNAAKVLLELSISDSQLNIHFSDNGIGFDCQKEIRQGLGLKNIHNRVERLRGNIRVSSIIDAGSDFTITIPLKLS